MGEVNDSIQLILPFKAEYVIVARLAVSGIANRGGFDIETIEDIKVAVAEVCNKLVAMGSKSAENYKVIFCLSDDNLKVIFDCEDKTLKSIFFNEDDQLGISIINALMDKVEFCHEDGYILLMSKAVERDS